MKRHKLQLIANKGGIRVEAQRRWRVGTPDEQRRIVKDGRNRYQHLEGASNRSDFSPRIAVVSTKTCTGIQIWSKENQKDNSVADIGDLPPQLFVRVRVLA